MDHGSSHNSTTPLVSSAPWMENPRSEWRIWSFLARKIIDILIGKSWNIIDFYGPWFPARHVWWHRRVVGLYVRYVSLVHPERWYNSKQRNLHGLGPQCFFPLLSKLLRIISGQPKAIGKRLHCVGIPTRANMLWCFVSLTWEMLGSQDIHLRLGCLEKKYPNFSESTAMQIVGIRVVNYGRLGWSRDHWRPIVEDRNTLFADPMDCPWCILH